jgi:hypothetical protein
VRISERQIRVLNFIRIYQGWRGESPLVREIQNRFGWKSDSSARVALQQLIANGLIVRRLDRGLRDIALTPKASQFLDD